MWYDTTSRTIERTIMHGLCCHRYSVADQSPRLPPVNASQPVAWKKENKKIEGRNERKNKKNEEKKYTNSTSLAAILKSKSPSDSPRL